MSARRNRRRTASDPPLVTSPRKNVGAGDLSDLRSWLDSRMENLRAESEQLHVGCVEELETTTAKLKKRIKTELDSSSRHGDEVNRSWKAFAADLDEDIKEVQTACKEFTAKAQTHGASLKSSYTDFLASVENQLEGLRSKYIRAA